MKHYQKIATQMLFIKDYSKLCFDFRLYLDDIANDVSNAGGELLSRQIVAMAIETWKKLNPHRGIKDNG